jgi:hypothetical protein
MSIVPDEDQGIFHGMPAFKLRGKTIAGFAAFKNHLSYLPHSGSVIPALAKQSQRASNPCLHLERLSRAESVTCGGGGKWWLTWASGSGSILVSTPRFSTSCGINTGSPDADG